MEGREWFYYALATVVGAGIVLFMLHLAHSCASDVRWWCFAL